MARSPSKQRFIDAATIVGWGIIVCLNAVCIFLFGSNGDLQAAFALVFSIGLVIATTMLIRSWRIWRAAPAPKVLGYLEQAVRLNLPLPGMLAAAAAGEQGATRNRLLALRNLLEQGVSLDIALAAVLPEISPSVGNRIAVAARGGRLESALRRINRAGEPSDPFTVDSIAMYRTYPWVVLITMGLAVAMLSTFVFPKFLAIRRSGHSAPFAIPWTMRTVLWISKHPIFQAIWLLVGLMTILVLGRSLKDLFGRPKLAALRPSSLMDYVTWWMPVVGSCARNRGMAELCESIADTTEAGEPLDLALRDAARSVGSDVLAARARRWADNAAAGESISESARKAKMPALLVGMLATVRDGESLHQVMLFLARHYRSRFSRTVQLIRAAYVPAVVLVLGLGVALIELSVFQYMVALIGSSANYQGGF
jgi:type II secretory pathway component PulF